MTTASRRIAGAAGPASRTPAPGRRRGVAQAEALAGRLDRPIGALGVVFLFVVLGQNLAGPATADALGAVGWALWAVFVAELALRAYVAKDQKAFWRRNWWQVVFLAVPFLRLARALSTVRILRVARVGGVLGSAVRGSRSAARLLSGRIAWLAVVTAVVILASSQLLLILGAYTTYAEALHASALATVAAVPLGADSTFARWLEVGLAVYSVAVFATLAGALGAFFLDRRDDTVPTPAGPAASRRTGRGTPERPRLRHGTTATRRQVPAVAGRSPVP